MVCHPKTPSQTVKVELGLPAGSWWKLVVEGSMLEIVRAVLELLRVSWALGRDGNNFFLNPGHSQVKAHCTCTYINLNAFFCIELLLIFLQACVVLS